MKNKAIIVLLISCLLTGCKNTEKRNNEITKVSLYTGLCYGTCPIQTVEIDSSLTVKYHGMKFANSKGYYIGKVTPAIWDSINSRFEKIKFKELDSVYDHSADDPPVYFKIYYQNKIKTITAQSASLPEDVQKTYRWLIDVALRVKLSKTNDTLIFEREHLPFMAPPTPPPPPRFTSQSQ